jgi:hypothetical protein
MMRLMVQAVTAADGQHSSTSGCAAAAAAHTMHELQAARNHELVLRQLYLQVQPLGRQPPGTAPVLLLALAAGTGLCSLHWSCGQQCAARTSPALLPNPHAWPPNVHLTACSWRVLIGHQLFVQSLLVLQAGAVHTAPQLARIHPAPCGWYTSVHHTPSPFHLHFHPATGLPCTWAQGKAGCWQRL